jgi:phage-related protein
MPRTIVRVYRHLSGELPLIAWLEGLAKTEPRAHRKCLQRILLLAEKGHELQRPLAATLRDGIYELRARAGRVHYRVLYFFCGQNVVCLSHGITKTDKVPGEEIEHAVTRMKLVKRNLDKHTAEFEV